MDANSQVAEAIGARRTSCYLSSELGASCSHPHHSNSGVIVLIQPKAPEAKIRGSQKGFQRVVLGLERVLGVQRGPVGPAGPLELSALQ
jgi:hypothetical protein